MRLLHARANPLGGLRRSGGACGRAQSRHIRRSTNGERGDIDRRGDPRADERQCVPVCRLSEYRCRREARARVLRRRAHGAGGRERGAVMNAFTFRRVAAAEDAARAVAARPGAMFLAGGTTLVDLMKIDVLTPDTVVDVRRLALSHIDVSDDAITIGANVTNSQLAWHPVVRDRFPVLAEAILSGATTQLRNMATVAGNTLQRTRCPYFRDVHALCNRRQPGSGCDALDGFNRGHAVLGVSEHCIATHPSDMCVAMVVLDADVHTVLPDGTTRLIPFGEFHQAPGETPEVEFALKHGELITHIVIPQWTAARRSHYLKVRDRASYEFALASAAVVLDLEGDTIREARLGLGGVATKPWRAMEAEHTLIGRKASDDTFRDAAEIALAGAVAREHNHFKIELAKRTIVRALATARDANV